MPIAATADTAVLYNRVPRVTADFWIIKLMAVTMGETAADYLNVQIGLGLTMTSLIRGDARRWFSMNCGG